MTETAEGLLSRSWREIAARWPGKSADAAGIEAPAVHHMLDVAAVAECLLDSLVRNESLRQALALLVALHDLGKINVAFRSMLREGASQHSGSHWEVTEALLRRHDDLLAPVFGQTPRRRFQVYAATAGHHGRPPFRDLEHRDGRPTGAWASMLAAAGEEAVDDAAKVIEAFKALWPAASLASIEKAEIPVLGWRLAGLATAADWIGSNPTWFPARPPGPSPSDYLDQARSRAPLAISEAGLARPEAADVPLFDFAPRPMQAACAEVPLPDGPMLAILEDETGAGKTEAALLLARRMLRAGKGRGLYIALPTMATADAMFARVAAMLRRLFTGAPSLVLAHGRSGLHEDFREIAEGRDLNPDEPGPTEWLMDGRRRTLLADVGVGTVDQALLAVVRAKHAPLRQFGLSSKVLIVDEVHEMGDPYMGELVAELLHVHAALGGSAILLTATLPLGLRAKLIAAFETGAGRVATPRDDMAYPALTLPGVASPAVAAASATRGPVEVVRLGALDAALDLLTDAARAGAACVLIRNAVDEAVAAVAALRARDVAADLLHARFALVDRKRHEAAVLAAYGKARSARPGRVLVATQVVESSLDLDFDVMVSDLAPMAALIQRAGRLWRHMALRPAAGRPVAKPILHVLSPDPDDVTSDRWAQPVLGQGAFVYPVPLLWRSARVLFDAGRVEAPAGLRDLIERAHGDALALPEALDTADIRAAGAAGAARNLAWHNRIDWAAGYRRGASGVEDADYSTRLGRPQRILVLARDADGRLEPWAGGSWDASACQMSEVQASAARLAMLPLPDTMRDTPDVFRGLPQWLARTRRLVRVGAENDICEGLRYEPELGLVFADRDASA